MAGTEQNEQPQIGTGPLVALAAGAAGLCFGAAIFMNGASERECAAGAILAAAMAGIAVVDARSFRIPDRLSLPLIPLGWIASGAAVHGQATPILPLDHVAASLAGGLVLFGFRAVYEALRGRTGLGLGDVKLFAAAGAWVGPWLLPYVLLLASAGAIVFAAAQALFLRRQDALAPGRRMPLGSFLAVSTVLMWAVGAG